MLNMFHIPSGDTQPCEGSIFMICLKNCRFKQGERKLFRGSNNTGFGLFPHPIGHFRLLKLQEPYGPLRNSGGLLALFTDILPLLTDNTHTHNQLYVNRFESGNFVSRHIVAF